MANVGKYTVPYMDGSGIKPIISAPRKIDIITDYYPQDPCMVYIYIYKPTFGAISVVNVGKQMYRTWSSWDPLPNKWDDHPV